MDLINYFGLNYESPIINTPQIWSGSFFVKKCDFTLKLLNSWKNVFNQINLIDDSDSIYENHKEFYENRHDQSALSIICKKNNIFSLSASECDWAEFNGKRVWIHLNDYPILAKRDLKYNIIKRFLNRQSKNLKRLKKKFSNSDWLKHLMIMTEATARTYMALSKLFYFKGEYFQALVWGASAEELMQNFFNMVSMRRGGSRTEPIHADIYLYRGETYAYMAAALLALEGKKEKSEEMFSVAQSYFVAVDAFFGSAIVSAIRAKAFYDANLIDDFLLAADKAVALASKIGFGELVWQIEALRGQVLMAQGDLEKAEMSLRRAQEAIDLVSGSLSSDRAKLKFGIGKDSVTRLLTEIDTQKGDLTSLYADLERGRARAFVDMIGESLVGGFQDREQTENIRKLDAQIRQRRLLLSVTGGSTEELSSQYTSGEDELISKRADLIAQLRMANPDLADALSISTIALAEVEAKLLDGDVIVYPLPTDFESPIKLLLITNTKRELKLLEISREHLGDLLSDFQFGVELDDAGEQVSAAQALYVGLKMDEWGVVNNVYMVPSSEFYFVAWGALPLKNPVIVLPMAGWLARDFVNEVTTGAVIIGDPEYGGIVPQLPGARLEAISIAARYGVEPLTGAKATIAGLRERSANGVFLLHLATHGIFDSVNPMHGKVWEHELTIKDGYVYAPDLPGLGLKPKWDTLAPYRVG